MVQSLNRIPEREFYMSIATIAQTIDAATANVVRSYGQPASSAVEGVKRTLARRNDEQVAVLRRGARNLGATTAQVDAILIEAGLIEAPQQVAAAHLRNTPATGDATLDAVVRGLADLTATVNGLVNARR